MSAAAPAVVDLPEASLCVPLPQLVRKHPLQDRDCRMLGARIDRGMSVHQGTLIAWLPPEAGRPKLQGRRVYA